MSLSAFHSELSGLLASVADDLRGVVGIRGANDRVDALVLLCRGVLRRSSACLIDGEPYVFGGECYEGCSLRVIGQDLGNLQ